MALTKVKVGGIEPNLGRRNLIVNGNFQNWQRSTSETGLGASAGYFTADRWRISTANSAGRFTMNRTAGDPDGFNYGLVINCTTADTSVAANEILLIQQKIEGQDLQHLKKGTSGAESVTISFYAKIVGSATDFVVTLYDNDNNRFISKLFTFTTSWVRYYFTVPGDTTGTLDQDNNSSLELWFWLHAGSNHTSGTLQTSWGSDTNANRAAGIDSIYSSTDNEFYLAGVQLEVGSQATPFEHRSFGEELALCQRYHTRIGAGGGYYAGNASGTSKIAAGFALPVAMRATPSTPPNVSVHRSGNQTVTCSIDSIALGYSNNTGIHLYARFVGFSVTDEVAYNIYLGGVLELDSEL
jgi:hypothetical protein